MEPTKLSADTYPAVYSAVTSLGITDPHLFRAARLPGARSLYEALKTVPPSDVIVRPTAMPVVTAPQNELLPIFGHLTKGYSAVGAAFPRGATFHDGRLDMCKQVVGPEYIGDLTTAVCHGGSSTELEHFLLGNNVVGDAGASDIANMIRDPNAPDLKTLYLAGNAFSAEGATKIADALVMDTSVRALWLKRNPIGPKGAVALGEMLAQNSTLETLDLVNTGLGDKGIEALFDGLSENRTLRTLYLDANGLGPKSADAIAAYYDQASKHAHNRVTGLFLGINRLGCSGAFTLASSLEAFGRLERLDIGANRVELEGLQALLKMANASPSLRYLGLGLYKSASDMGELPNWFGDDGAALIAKHIGSVEALEAIELKDVHIGPDGLAMLGDAVENQSALYELSTAQYGLKQPSLFNRIEKFLDRNVRTQLRMSLKEYRHGPLRVLKHGAHIDDIASIYRNEM